MTLKISLAFISLLLASCHSSFGQKYYYLDSTTYTDSATRFVGPSSIQCIWVNGPNAKKQYEELKALIQCGSGQFVDQTLTETIQDYSIGIETELKPQFTRLGFTFPARHTDTVLALLKAFVYNPKLDKACANDWMQSQKKEALYYSNHPDSILARAVNKQYWQAHAPNLDVESPYQYQLKVNERLHFSVATSLSSDSFLSKCPWFRMGETIAFSPLANRLVPELSFLGPKKMIQTVAIVFEIPHEKGNYNASRYTDYQVAMSCFFETLLNDEFSEDAMYPTLSMYGLNNNTNQIVLRFKSDNWLKKKAEIEAFIQKQNKFLPIEGDFESRHSALATWELCKQEKNEDKAIDLVLRSNNYPFLFNTYIIPSAQYRTFSSYGSFMHYTIVYGAAN